MAHLVKYLPSKHENLDLVPRTHPKQLSTDGDASLQLQCWEVKDRKPWGSLVREFSQLQGQL